MKEAIVRSKRKIIIVVTTFGIISLLSGVGVLANNILTKKISSSVSIEKLKAKGMTKEELGRILNEKYNKDLSKLKITLVAKDKIKEFTFKDLNVKYDFSKALEEAYRFGRDGNVINQIIKLSVARRDTKSINIDYNYDREFVQKLIDDLEKEMYKPAKEYEVLIEPEKVYALSGISGESIVKSGLLEQIEEDIRNANSDIINIKLTKIKPQKILKDELVMKINAAPIDATTEVVNNVIRVIEPVKGRVVKEKELLSIVSRLNSLENSKQEIPIDYIEANLQKEDVDKLLIKDELSTYNTQFYTGDVNNNNRAINISIAANKLNGTIIGAGKTFSFNDVIGPRTPSRGYMAAHAYISGKIIDSTGGGICQVSSTLYNSALLANLEIVERLNHMYTVGYVPKGLDATVSYGSTDFKFKNSRKYPIKINSWVTEENKLFITITGTNFEPNKRIELRSEILREIPQQTQYIYDPNMQKDTQYVSDWGMIGYVAKAYKVIYNGEQITNEVELGTSVYNSLPKKIVIGTKS